MNNNYDAPDEIVAMTQARDSLYIATKTRIYKLTHRGLEPVEFYIPAIPKEIIDVTKARESLKDLIGLSPTHFVIEEGDEWREFKKSFTLDKVEIFAKGFANIYMRGYDDPLIIHALRFYVNRGEGYREWDAINGWRD